MTQRVATFYECVHCYCLIQYPGQGHNCPVPNVGEANQPPSAEYLKVHDEVKEQGLKFIVIPAPKPF